MEKVILLDYRTGLAHIFEVRESKNLEDNVMKWCGKRSICFSECEWMAYNDIIRHKTKSGGKL